MCDPESANDSVDDSAKQEDDPQGRPGKDLVHKCNSDPGGDRMSGSSVSMLGSTLSRSLRHHTGGVTRKCVLTLDGYSYVIGEEYYFTFIILPKDPKNHGIG